MTDPTSEPTGHPVVDEVLASLGPLDEVPVDRHASVYEAAQEKLRACLSDAG